MTTLREAAQQALDYIRSNADYKMGHPAACETAHDLSETLAEEALQRLSDIHQEMEAEQKPVAWCALSIDGKHISYFDGKPVIMTGEVGNDCHPDPLFTVPQPTKPVEQQPVEQAEPSPTSGMNIAQRILHVGGRNNAAGYVEFGSIQAVQALVRQAIRDLRLRRIPDHELVTMYAECPSSDADMIAFAHDVMDAMLTTAKAPQPTKQPLTDEDIDNAMAENKQTLIDAADNYWKMRRAYARIIEKAHGITGETK